MLSEKSKSRDSRDCEKNIPIHSRRLLPALYLAQKDYGGWLPEQAFDEVAEVMGLPPTLVAAMASFYTMLNRRPVGRAPDPGLYQHLLLAAGC